MRRMSDSATGRRINVQSVPVGKLDAKWNWQMAAGMFLNDEIISRNLDKHLALKTVFPPIVFFPGIPLFDLFLKRNQAVMLNSKKNCTWYDWYKCCVSLVKPTKEIISKRFSGEVGWNMSVICCYDCYDIWCVSSVISWLVSCQRMFFILSQRMSDSRLAEVQKTPSKAECRIVPVFAIQNVSTFINRLNALLVPFEVVIHHSLCWHACMYKCDSVVATHQIAPLICYLLP